jgi:hypothetical protein
MSAHAMKGDKERYLLSGMDGRLRIKTLPTRTSQRGDRKPMLKSKTF